MPQLIDLSGATLPRSIVAPSRTFENYLTIEEDHTDETVITEHPIDKGAVMSDHIYLKPPILKLRLGWSNADDAASDASYVLSTYAALLALKNARQLFTIYTGKRLYNNMFVLSLSVPTTAQSEWSMIAECLFRQLLLVNVSSASGQPTSTTAAAGAQPGSPQTNQSTTNGGFNQLQSGNGPTQIPLGDSIVVGPGGFTQLKSGTGPTEIPLGVPNTSGGAAGPQDFFGPF